MSKQKLLQYAKINELFTIGELAELEETISTDNDYIEFEHFDSKFVKKQEISPKLL